MKIKYVFLNILSGETMGGMGEARENPIRGFSLNHYQKCPAGQEPTLSKKPSAAWAVFSTVCPLTAASGGFAYCGKRGFRSLRWASKGSAPAPRHLLKKVDENFYFSLLLRRFMAPTSICAASALVMQSAWESICRGRILHALRFTSAWLPQTGIVSSVIFETAVTSLISKIRFSNAAASRALIGLSESNTGAPFES